MKQQSNTFKNDGSDFSAFAAVSKWCAEHGYVVGSMQRDAPIGVHRASECSGISKWRNMGAKERAALDGRITWAGGGPREGDAILTLTQPAPPR